jgi:23S rRNA (adenine2503-C2)-methyltransferase
VNLLDLTPRDAARALAAWVGARGEPAFRARQLLRRLWRRPVAAWADATELPGRLRDYLERDLPLPRPVLLARQESADGTIKFLWGFERQGAVEAVLIPEGRRRTLCISSQAGCAYGCVFCATGRMGLQRHLAPWEITAQLRELSLDPALGAAPTNVVFMGMGEPLHNWAAVDRALTILHDPDGFGIGARHLTVSTVGIVPRLEDLAARPEPFRVALSLHSADAATRAALMPVERKYPLSRVLEALRRFERRVTFEYVMIEGMNDALRDADLLAAIARPLGAHVNLLPLHPGGAAALRATPPRGIERFARALRARGVNTTVRRSRGLDISAACGQLRVAADRGHQVAAQQDRHVDEEAGVRLAHDPSPAEHGAHPLRRG